MMTRISCAYLLLVVGVYCYILPNSILGARRIPRFSSNRGLLVLAKEIATDDDSRHSEFKELLKPLLIDRMPDTENSRRVQEYISRFFERKGWTVEKDGFDMNTPYGPKHFTNIIATFNPFAKKKLVVACHYDSKNISDSNNRKFIAATDSAVPCAIMMDVVEKLNCMLRRKSDNDITLQMLFLDGEEAYLDWTETDSLYGSRYLAQKWKDEPDQGDGSKSRLEAIDLFVLLDLIGTKDVKFTRFTDNLSRYFDTLEDIETKLRTKNLQYPRQERLFSGQVRTYIEDDHKPFMNAHSGLQVLHLISYPFPRVWHRMSDNEKNIDYDVTDNFNRIFRVFVANYLHLKEESCKKK